MTTESPAVEELDDEHNSEVVAEHADSADAEAATPSRLEEEGDVAADYLEELLDIADVDGDIDIEVRNGRTYISIVAEEQTEALRGLVGREGQVLEALQELTRLNVLSATGHRSRLVLDITGYRDDRAGVLQEIAEDAVQNVKDTGAAVSLKPMGAYERKIVHDAVADLGFVSESEGEGTSRHIVVTAAE